MKPLTKTILWLTIFSISMGFLESSIVFYLRKLYYPEGFHFPLIPLTSDIATTEFFRELATLLMLMGAGILAGKNKMQRFAFFLYCFAVWDIFYYVFLKVIVNWPQSLLTWDILFLIPVPWVGPVVGPCIVSLLMILFAFMILYFQQKGTPLDVRFFEWMLLFSGCCIVIVSFMWDYLRYISRQGTNTGVWTLSSNKNMFEEIKNYIPQSFNWSLFLIGQGLLLFGLLFIYLRTKKSLISK